MNKLKFIKRHDTDKNGSRRKIIRTFFLLNKSISLFEFLYSFFFKGGKKKY